MTTYQELLAQARQLSDGDYEGTVDTALRLLNAAEVRIDGLGRDFDRLNEENLRLNRLLGKLMRPEKRTVAVCRTCWNDDEGFYLPVEEAGHECPMDHDLDYDQKPRKLIKRILYICTLPNHCEDVGYTERKACIAHMEGGREVDY